MRIFERNICVKIAKSKEKYLKYFNFDQIKTSKNKMFISNLHAELKRVGSSCHIDTIIFS